MDAPRRRIMSLAITMSALIALGTLTVTGAMHALRQQQFRRALSLQAVWPSYLIGPVALVVCTAELVIGAAGIRAITLGYLESSRWFLLAAAMLLGGFAIYGRYIAVHRPEAPCGCGSNDENSMAVPARAAALCALSAAASVGSQSLLDLTPLSAQAVLAVVAATGCAISLWILPASLQLPFVAKPAGYSMDIK